MIKLLKKIYWNYNNLSRAESGFYIIFPILGLTLLVFSFNSADTLFTDFHDLSINENKIQSINVDRNYLTIRLEDNEYEFSTDNLRINKEISIGDFVKIYYKKRIISKQVNILQLERENSVLIAFSDTKKNLIMVIILSSTLAFSVIGLFLFYVTKLRDK